MTKQDSDSGGNEAAGAHAGGTAGEGGATLGGARIGGTGAASNTPGGAGGAPEGGLATGGDPVDGGAGGEFANGGVTGGGLASGGAAASGAGNGGVETGGAIAGGSEPGGSEPGGSEPGGSEPGGSETGGSETGGSETGGSETGGSETGGSETGGSETGGSETGGSGGAQPTCADGEADCGSTCAVLATSPDHCGACDHSCGGGECVSGECTPMSLYSLAGIISLALSDDEILFGNAEYLWACPKTGCTGAPRQIARMSYPVEDIAWLADGTVVFQSALAQVNQRPALFACPDTACPGAPGSFVSDGLSTFNRGLTPVGGRVIYQGGAMGTGFTTCTNGTCEAGTSLASGVRSRPYTADLANAYFVNTTSGGSGLLSCPLSTDECTPSTVTPGDWGTTTAMATHDGELFWVEGRRLDYDESRIYHCDPANCSTPTLLINGLDYPRELAVDADGSYWIPSGSPTIQHCAPDHCAGGAQDLVTGLSAPTWLRTDDGFVYWLDGDHIWRVAK